MTGLVALSLPASIRVLQSAVFAHCSSLRALTMPANTPLAAIPNLFCYSCSSLAEFSFPLAVTSIGGIVLNCVCSLTSSCSL